jgi:hypothetical protein
VARVQVLNHDKTQAAIRRHRGKKFFQRIQSAGRCADADYLDTRAFRIHNTASSWGNFDLLVLNKYIFDFFCRNRLKFVAK